MAQDRKKSECVQAISEHVPPATAIAYERGRSALLTVLGLVELEDELNALRDALSEHAATLEGSSEACDAALVRRARARLDEGTQEQRERLKREKAREKKQRQKAEKASEVPFSRMSVRIVLLTDLNGEGAEELTFTRT